MTEELKPCPFCGSEKTKLIKNSTLYGFNGLDERIEQHKFYVRCNKCFARGGTASGKVITRLSSTTLGLSLALPEWATTDEALKAEAVAKWNTIPLPTEEIFTRKTIKKSEEIGLPCTIEIEPLKVTFTNEDVIGIEVTEATYAEK